MFLTIRGASLDIISMSAEEILVKGFITGINFE